MNLNEPTFICEGCGHEFMRDPAWTQQMADDEYLLVYGEDDGSECGSTCDKCFNEVKQWIEAGRPVVH